MRTRTLCAHNNKMNIIKTMKHDDFIFPSIPAQDGFHIMSVCMSIIAAVVVVLMLKKIDDDDNDDNDDDGGQGLLMPQYIRVRCHA